MIIRFLRFLSHKCRTVYLNMIRALHFNTKLFLQGRVNVKMYEETLIHHGKSAKQWCFNSVIHILV